MPRKKDFAKTKEKGMFENAKFSQKVRMRESVLQGVRFSRTAIVSAKRSVFVFRCRKTSPGARGQTPQRKRSENGCAHRAGTTLRTQTSVPLRREALLDGLDHPRGST